MLFGCFEFHRRRHQRDAVVRWTDDVRRGNERQHDCSRQQNRLDSDASGESPKAMCVFGQRCKGRRAVIRHLDCGSRQILTLVQLKGRTWLVCCWQLSCQNSGLEQSLRNRVLTREMPDVRREFEENGPSNFVCVHVRNYTSECCQVVNLSTPLPLPRRIQSMSDSSTPLWFVSCCREFLLGNVRE